MTTPGRERARVAVERALEVAQDLRAAIDCQGTGHEQVITADEFAKDNEAWHERVQRAVDEIPRGEVIPAAKLREFIEAEAAALPQYSRSQYYDGKDRQLERITAWLDEHTTQPTASEPVQADLRPCEGQPAEEPNCDEKIAYWMARWQKACDELAKQEAVMVAADRLHEAYEAMLEGRDIGRLADWQPTEDHESGPAGSTTDGPASPREGST